MDASDPDYDNIQKAQAEIGKMIAKANEKKRIVDNFQVLIEIQNRIILPAGSNLIKKGALFACMFVRWRVRSCAACVSRVAVCALTSRERSVHAQAEHSFRRADSTCRSTGRSLPSDSSSSSPISSSSPNPSKRYLIILIYLMN
jgi:hypothetical protein